MRSRSTQTFFQQNPALPDDLPHPDEIRRGQEKKKRSDGGKSKPVCLVKVRTLSDFVLDARAIPHPIAAAGPHMEGVRPKRNIRVYRCARGVGIEPSSIHAIQAILQSNLFRRGEIDGLNMNLNMMGCRRQNQFLTCELLLFPDSDRAHEDFWFSRHPRRRRQIDHCQSFDGCHPKLAIRGKGKIGSTDTTLNGVHSVGAIENTVIERTVMVPDSVD